VSGVIVWEAPDGDHLARRVSLKSMTAVAEGRRDDWLALFAPGAVVEDPVGPSMLDPEGKGHRGVDGIRQFWERNFGAISRFHFLVKDSFANGPCCANVLTITMWLGGGAPDGGAAEGGAPESGAPEAGDGATMTLDCVVIYTVNDDGQITSIRAHWEPDRAMATITTLSTG
jgi:ketosteroid isomerase-like protein